MKIRKIITPGLLCLSFISVLLVMAALQDIYHNREPLTEEWQVVRYGVLLIIIFHGWVALTLWRNRQKSQKFGKMGCNKAEYKK